MAIKNSLEPITIEDLRIFANKGMECLQSNADKLWECLQFSTDKRLKNPNSVQLMALVQGGGLHYAFTQGYAKCYLCEKEKGLKDIDIYTFFKRETGKENYKIRDNDDVTDILRCDLGPSKFGRKRCMDILPYSIKEFNDIADPCDAVKQWLEKGWNIIKGINLVGYDKETVNGFIKKATKEWNQQNGVEKEFHSQFLVSKAVIAIYPEEFLGKILWVNPELKK